MGQKRTKCQRGEAGMNVMLVFAQVGIYAHLSSIPPFNECPLPRAEWHPPPPPLSILTDAGPSSECPCAASTGTGWGGWCAKSSIRGISDATSG